MYIAKELREKRTGRLVEFLYKGVPKTCGYCEGAMSLRDNFHICWYGMCHFLECLCFEQKINFGVSFLVKSQVVINFRVSF